MQQTVGQRLRYLRELRGFGVEELWQKSGVSRNTIYRIESGKTDPAPETLVLLAKPLDTTASYLLFGETSEATGVYPVWARGLPDLEPGQVAYIRKQIEFITGMELHEDATGEATRGHAVD